MPIMSLCTWFEPLLNHGQIEYPRFLDYRKSEQDLSSLRLTELKFHGPCVHMKVTMMILNLNRFVI